MGFFWFKTLLASTIAGGQGGSQQCLSSVDEDASRAGQTQGPAKTRGRSRGSGGHHSALLDGDHRSWHCPRHTDPDGDAILRNPTTGVRGCVCACVGGEEEASASVGGVRGGKSEVSSLFGFWSMSKNVKDPTDRHWNMNFFFFFFRETDRRGWKKRQFECPHLIPSCLTLPPSHGLGMGEDARAEEGMGGGGSCES